jgi:hypothetical protein
VGKGVDKIVFILDIHYRKGISTDTTHCRVGTQGLTHTTRWTAVWTMRCRHTTDKTRASSHSP